MISLMEARELSQRTRVAAIETQTQRKNEEGQLSENPELRNSTHTGLQYPASNKPPLTTTSPAIELPEA